MLRVFYYLLMCLTFVVVVHTPRIIHEVGAPEKGRAQFSSEVRSAHEVRPTADLRSVIHPGNSDGNVGEALCGHRQRHSYAQSISFCLRSTLIRFLVWFWHGFKRFPSIRVGQRVFPTLIPSSSLRRLAAVQLLRLLGSDGNRCARRSDFQTFGTSS